MAVPTARLLVSVHSQPNVSRGARTRYLSGTNDYFVVMHTVETTERDHAQTSVLQDVQVPRDHEADNKEEK